MHCNPARYPPSAPTSSICISAAGKPEPESPAQQPLSAAAVAPVGNPNRERINHCLDRYLSKTGPIVSGDSERGHHAISRDLLRWAGSRSQWAPDAKQKALDRLHTLGCWKPKITHNLRHGAYEYGQAHPVTIEAAFGTDLAAWCYLPGPVHGTTNKPPQSAYDTDPEAAGSADQPPSIHEPPPSAYSDLEPDTGKQRKPSIAIQLEGHSDQDDAKAFLAQREHPIHYEPRTGRWLMFDPNHRWLRCTDAAPFTAIAEFLNRESAAMDAAPQQAMRSSRKCQAVMTFVQKYTALPETDLFEENPDMLGLPDGMICNLETGEIRQQTPADRCTRSTGVTPDPNMPTPNWDRFLKQTYAEPEGGGLAVSKFYERFMGYALTGHNTEHMFGFLQGKTRSGKGTAVSTSCYIFGDYQRTANVRAFMSGRNEPHQTVYAKLAGVRLVTMPDVKSGKLDDDKINEFVAGDQMTANFMHQDEFDFIPIGKLLFASSKSPNPGGTDSGTGERMALFHHPHHRARAQRDRNLLAKLKAESPGILARWIDYAREWYENGKRLPDMPKAVTTATESFLAGFDDIKQWADDCLEFGGEAWTRQAAAVKSLRDWAAANDVKFGRTPGPVRLIVDNLKDVKLDRHKKHGRYFTGFRVKGARAFDAGLTGGQPSAAGQTSMAAPQKARDAEPTAEGSGIADDGGEHLYPMPSRLSTDPLSALQIAALPDSCAPDTPLVTDKAADDRFPCI